MLEADKLCQRVAFINQGKIAALDTPHNLKQQYGKRMVIAQVLAARMATCKIGEIVLDTGQTAGELQNLFSQEKVVTIHSEEASLEDIFIHITGRGLYQRTGKPFPP